MSSSSPFDASIPVLTEVIDTQALLHQDVAPARVPPPFPEQPEQAGSDDEVVENAVVETAVVETAVVENAVVESAVVETAVVDAVIVDAYTPHATTVAAVEHAPVDWAPADAASTDWAALEQRLCERILQQLQGQVGFLIEQRIRESMADALQHALASVAGQLADGLGGALEQIVTRAVGEELLHLRQK